MWQSAAKASPRGSRSAVKSGLLTGVSTVTVSGAAAIAGVLLAHKFGRTAETDGFLAAYTIYLVLVIGAQAFRFVVVPDLTRAAADARLGAETGAYSLAFLALALPASAVVIAFDRPLGDAITGSLPPEAGSTAGSALVWLVPGAFAQLLAALYASALAARDSYAVAAIGYSLGAVAGLALFAVLADSHGLVSLAWGVALNGGITLAVLLAATALRGDVRGGPGRDVTKRLLRLAEGAAVPVALQGLYMIALRFAADIGVGKLTSLSFAYLLAAVLVAATASSLSLVSAAPLTRRGLDAGSAAAHVVHSSWLSLVVIAGAAGVFTLVGGRLVGAVLGEAYSGGVGDEVGQLVVYLAPWMVVSVAFSVTFPLLFVMERARALIPLALGALALHVPLTWGLREAFGLRGIELALAVSTLAVLVVLMLLVSPRTLSLAAVGVGELALIVAAAAALSFGALSFVIDGIPGALVGLALYMLLLAAARPRGLREAWAYVRALHY
jgi:O-antigen/teichoic acid export membrane protein